MAATTTSISAGCLCITTMLMTSLTIGSPLSYDYELQEPSQHLDANDLLPHRGGNHYLPPEAPTLAPIIQKQFFFVSADDVDERQEKPARHIVLGRPQRNYRVIFIRAPSVGGAQTRYTAELAPNEDKTVIYILSRKENDLDAQDIVTPAPQPASKPEIFFIKYKTSEEAAAVQKEIEHRYESLGGTKESSMATAPVTSIIGSLDGQTADGGYDYRRIGDDETSLLPVPLPPLLPHLDGYLPPLMSPMGFQKNP